MRHTEETFTFSFIDDATTVKCLARLKGNKTPGLDSISPKFLKEANKELITAITDLFNLWIWNGDFPDDLKRSVIVPVHKKGSPNDPKNYRPISLLMSIAKLFEIVLQKQLNAYFDKLLSNDMFGFRTKLGCEHALLEITEKSRKCVDRKEKVLLMSLDLSRAFDVVNHKLLLAKLSAYGLDSAAYNLIDSYLTNRRQCTRVRECVSDENYIISGVPQGSILGPLLFNIFVSDLSLCVKCFMSRYADDTSLILTGRKPSELKAAANDCLNKVVEWFHSNSLLINPTKTQFILFGTTRDRDWDGFSLDVDGKRLQPLDSLELLGMTIDPQLSYEAHISKQLKKAGFALKLSRGIVNIASISDRQTLYNCYVMPHLRYCCSLFVGLSKGQLNRIHRFTGLATRALKLQQTTFAPYEEICVKRALVLLHQALHSGMPPVFAGELQITSGVYNMRSSSRLILPSFKSSYMANSVLILAAKKWNSLPPQMEKLKKLSNTSSFSRGIDTLFAV
jgi:hypothetical protein